VPDASTLTNTFILPARRAIRDVQSTLAFWLAASILVFNLLDGILTMVVVSFGLASEANPLMAAPLDWGSVPFIAVKTGLVSLGVYLLYLRRERRLANVALFGLSAVYGALMVYHFNSVQAIAAYFA
jgi:hypothetical protein